MVKTMTSVRDAVLGKEERVPVCVFRRKRPIYIFYTYYHEKSKSHRLEFRKGKRTLFEIFLPRYGEDIARICSIMDEQLDIKVSEKSVFNFWQRLMFHMFAGKMTWSHDLLIGPSSEMETPFGHAGSEYQYRLAHLRNGKKESIIIVSSRQGNMDGAVRKEQKTEFNWFKMSLSEFKDFIGNLYSFLMSKEFAEIQSQLPEKLETN